MSVQRYRGNSGVRTPPCAEQFRAMAFAQLTWRESLRDIEASLVANASKLYAMGFRPAIKRSTLADANESRDWRIWSWPPCLVVLPEISLLSVTHLPATSIERIPNKRTGYAPIEALLDAAFYETACRPVH